jgi:hypothetical protein
MVLRGLLTIWFLTTSVLGPAPCCCSPAAAFGAPQPEHATVAKPVPAPEAACPHCQDKPGKPSAPEKGSPSGSTKPCPARCPCKPHSIAPAVPDGAGVELRALAQFNWLPADPLFGSVFASPVLTPAGVTGPSNHTGPPPLSGVERLHRLHVLLC